MTRLTLFALAAVAAVTSRASAQLTLQQVCTGFNQPLFLTGAPGDSNPNQVYVVEKGGLVRTLNTSTGAIGATPFLNLRAQLTATGGGTLLTGGEQGLLGMAFGPDFNNGNGFVYVNYVAQRGTQGDTLVDRFTVTNGAIVANSRANIITIAPDLVIGNIYQTNHKGGWIGFGPDKLLYIATGDGGSSNDPNNVAQNLTSSLGKMLRINPNTSGSGYTVPGTRILNIVILDELDL